MKVVVTGASGNVGTSVLAALAAEPAVEEIVGIARRRPSAELPKVEWRAADVAVDELEPHFAGADAVVHLAWLIQPSHDEATMERTNVLGSRRVFAAVVAAGVPKLIHASSVGAYSPGPKDRAVDESWPTEGIPSSAYSRHKAAVERQLDELEAARPELRVVRLRPGLIFKGEAATEIQRYFAGPLLPRALLRPGLIPLTPDVPGLRFQSVHSLDVGRAYAAAVLGDVGGAFNIAAAPAIGTPELAELLEARPLPVPGGLIRAAVDLSWRLHLQPADPGWIDLALQVPIMDTARARAELGWEPRTASLDALAELLNGLRRGCDGETPPLRRDGLPA
jgi:UDP-glucose 4-epimerase